RFASRLLLHRWVRRSRRPGATLAIKTDTGRAELFPGDAAFLPFAGQTVRLRFDGCVFDSEERQLTRNGEPVRLTAKAFRLLEILAERRPAVVTRAELRKLLWPDAVVGGTTIERLVCEVREAIGDRGRPGRVVRTVHRVGYGFSGAAVEEVRPALRTAPT